MSVMRRRDFLKTPALGLIYPGQKRLDWVAGNGDRGKTHGGEDSKAVLTQEARHGSIVSPRQQESCEVFKYTR